MWVATHYFNLGDNVEAERNYKLLFQNTNWPPSELTYQAQLMAGHAAVRHQDWKSAETYFTQLYNNKNGPSNDLRLAALLAHGRTLMLHLDPAETNRLANVEEATKVFGRVYDENPTNRLALEALLEKAKCYKEWALARQQYDSLTNALNTYDQVLHARQADVVLRSEAKVGMAVTLSKWADQKAGKERTALLEQALNHCLDVVYGNISVLHEGERLDQWWTKEAGVKAFDIADALQAWSQEVGLYQRLTNSVWPQLDASIVKRFKAAQDKLEREKASH
jgi:hypothetical protein